MEVKSYQVAFFDSKGLCFDEAFYEPAEAEKALDFLRPNLADLSFMVKSRIFIHFNDGRSFELVNP